MLTLILAQTCLQVQFFSKWKVRLKNHWTRRPRTKESSGADCDDKHQPTLDFQGHYSCYRSRSSNILWGINLGEIQTSQYSRVLLRSPDACSMNCSSWKRVGRPCTSALEVHCSPQERHERHSLGHSNVSMHCHALHTSGFRWINLIISRFIPSHWCFPEMGRVPRSPIIHHVPMSTILNSPCPPMLTLNKGILCAQVSQFQWQ